MREVCAIVLAAGESRRMGSPKMLLPFNGMTVIEQVITNVKAATGGDIMVVLGSGYKEIARVIARYSVMHCYNDNYHSGMLSSVQCGFLSLPGQCGAALIMPGDQPMIGPREINKVITAWQAFGKGIVMPVHNGRRGHPLIVDLKYRDEVLALPGQDGLRALAEHHPDDVHEAETDDPSVLRDIDTREDYLNEINLIERDGRDNQV